MYVRPIALCIRGFVVLAAVCCVSLAKAQPVVPATVNNNSAGFGAWYYSGGYKAQMGAGGGSNMAPLKTTPTGPGGNLSGWQPAGNFGVNNQVATGVTINAQSSVPFPNGATAAVNAEAAVAKASMGKAIARAAVKLAGSLPAIGTAIAIADVVAELGVAIKGNGPSGAYGGANTFERNLSSDGMEYRISNICTNYCRPLDWSPAKGAACGTAMSVMSAWYGATWPGTREVVSSDPVCTLKFSNGGYSDWYSYSYDARAVTENRTEPVTEQQLADMIASKSGWPVSSAIARGLSEAIKAGQSVDVGTPTLTLAPDQPGLAPSKDVEVTKDSVPAPTPDNPNATRDTTTTKETTLSPTVRIDGDTLSYEPKITTKTTTTTKEPDGTVVTTGPTTSTSEGTKNINQDGVKTGTGTSTGSESGTDTPGLCDLFPDISACAKLGTSDSAKLPNATKDVSVVAATFAGSATCPAPITFSAFGASYVLPYDPLCSRLAALRPFILALAAVAAAWVLADSFKVT